MSQAITFVFKQLKRICTNIQAQRSMKNSNYKSQKKNPGNYRTKRRYFLRRSDNKAPFLHKRNVRWYNHRKNYYKTCRCFICNSPDHLSKACPNKDQKGTLVNMKSKRGS
jgi:hypothetical protein